MNLLELFNISKVYTIKESAFGKTRELKAVDDVSFYIKEKEIVGLVGESGCGKSTIGKLIVGLEKPTSGKVLIAGNDISSREYRLNKNKTHCQMIFQDPYNSLNPQKRIYDLFEEILRLFSSLSKSEIKEEIFRLIKLVGLQEKHLFRYPREFSGGQRQRIGIARAIAVKPEIIIADEPVSSLDVSIQAQIINLFAEIQEKTAISILFISHDLAVVESICDRIMVMYLGKIIESGLASEIIKSSAHPYTRALIDAVPVPDINKKHTRAMSKNIPSPIDMPKGCRFNTRCPMAFEKCFKVEPELRLIPGSEGHFCACFAVNTINPEV